MPQPIAVKDGICFAFPDILQTPAAPSPVPLPYPNIAQLSDATKTASSVNAGGKAVIVEDSEIASSSGGEAGTAGAPPNQKCTFTSFSGTVKANGKKIVRQMDQTSQNNGNAVGMVMSGVSTVMVGG
jgi:uncharacterized Zn-binding protein involved in type VI secretion